VLPLEKFENKNRDDVANTHVGSSSALFAAILFWVVAAGYSVSEAVLSVVVIAGVGIWGLLLVKTFAPRLPDPSDIGYWLLGPCVGIGAMTLFLLRLFTSEVIFLSLFLFVPSIWVVLSARSLFRERSLIKDFVGSLQNTTYTFHLAIGIVGLTLVRGWDWAAPIAAVSLLASLLMSTRVAKTKLASTIFIASLLPTTWLAIANRNPLWWRTAEGIPFDETSLESISKGLIRWGPTTNPLHHGLDGASAAAYHHLLYITTGLTDRFAQPGPYEALAIIGPIVSGFSICLTLVLFVRVVLRNGNASTKFSPSVLLGLFACLLGLRGEGFGSPSTWFGVASLVASLLIIEVLSQKAPNLRQLFLVAFAVVTVAFSKGVFVYAVVIIAVSLALFDWKTRWKIAITAVFAAFGVIVWFSWASVRVDEFVIDFWAYSNFQSQFSLDLYTFRVFFNRLISPIILGILCAFILRYSKLVRVRQIGFSLLVVLAAAVVSQLFVTSTGPRSFELFYVPGIFAASILILLLAISSGRNSIWQNWQTVIVVALALALVALAPPLGGGFINPFTIVTILVALFTGWSLLRKRVGRGGLFADTGTSIALSSLFISLTAVMAFVLRDFPEFPQYSRLSIQSDSSNWVGSTDFIEAVDFIQSETANNGLFAFSICDRDLSKWCEVDFRPAALMGRRFLALDPLFSRDAVNVRTWSDVELSQAIGALPPSKVVDDLIARGVNYVLIDHLRVSSEWIQNAKDVGAKEIYSSTSYSVLQLKTS
jgi:hypothetical protein